MITDKQCPPWWSSLIDERDNEGNLTDMALALDAIQDHGCDCGTDELGTCLACRCELALCTERTKVRQLEEENTQLRQGRDEARRELVEVVSSAGLVEYKGAPRLIATEKWGATEAEWLFPPKEEKE